MDVLLVQPPFSAFSEMPPLNLASLAASLKKENYDVQVIDFNLWWKKSLNDMVSEVLKTKSDVIGLTMWGNMVPFCIEFSKKIKEKDPSKIIITGGSQATLLAEVLIKIGSIDIVVKGEGEYTILDLMKQIETGGELAKINGIVYKVDNEFVSTPNRIPIKLDNLPFPAWNFFEDLKKYQKLEPMRTLPLQASRGCTYDCGFCSISKTWHRFQRRKSPFRVIEEIKYLIDSFDVNNLAFLDDTFTLNRDAVKSICKEMISRRIDVTWSMMTRTDLVDTELLKMLKDAGCVRIFYGIESISPRILKFIGGNQPTPEVSLRSIEKTLNTGISVDLSVIYGFPIETEKEVKALTAACLNFQRIGVENVLQHVLTPYLGTKITEMYEKNIIRSPLLRLANPSLINIDLLKEYPEYVPELWMFRHNDITTERFIELYTEARIRVSSKEIFL